MKLRFSLAASLSLFILGVQSFAAQNSYVVVDTGQDRCFGGRGEIGFPQPGEPFFGQDAQFAGNQPSYKDNRDGTITDLQTGLTWQKTPDFVVRTWDDAKRYAVALKLGGHADWRLPTMKELFSTVDFRGNMRTRTPYIDTTVFDFRYPDPNSGARDMDAQYWSSNMYVGTTMRNDQSAFGFNFADGRIKSYPIRFGGNARRPGVSKFVRCVRGKPYGENDFVDNRDGTITDRATGLTWTKADSGKPLNWQKALAYAENLKLAGHNDWRLPNVKELQSLVDYDRAPDARSHAARGPAIDPVFELTDPESWFWSNTTHIENQFGYYVCFGQAFSARTFGGKKMNAHGAGAVRSDPKSGDPSQWSDGHGPQSDEIRIYNYVRCVRGGAAESVTSSAAVAGTPRPAQPTRGAEQRFIGRLDRDGDGKVSAAEFDGPQHHFHVLDRNRDGFLDGNEAPQGPPGGRRGGPPGRRRSR